MRFIQKEPSTNGEFTATCKIFDIWDNVTLPQNAQLHYDCPWSYDYNEGNQDFLFEHEGILGDVSDYRKFIFKIPRYKKVCKHFFDLKLT